MAVIGSIRKRSGLLVVIIGVALAAFVLSDFLKPGSNRKVTHVGVIAGENISYNDFSIKAEEQMDIIKQRSQKDQLTPEEVFQAKQNTWTQIKNDILMGKEYEKLGLALTSDELFDQVQGTNPHSYILQYFRNPETNQYDRNLVINYLKNLDQMEPENKEQWLVLEKAIKQDRISTKYRNLLSKAYFLPKVFAEMEYKSSATQAGIRLFGARYNTIKDDAVSTTEEDFKNFYEKNKYKYSQDETVDIDYVIFEVAPSAEDMEIIQQQVTEIYTGFFTAENIENYVNFNSDERYDSSFFSQGQLPARLDSVMFDAEPGKVIGPYIEDESYKIARLVDVQFRPDSMRASHILISYKGAFNASEDVLRTKEEAEVLKDSLILVLQSERGRFIEFAMNYSNDPSVSENLGDLDWFADGMMVGPFNKAVLKANQGDITEAETPFGFHIIDVTGKQEDKKKVRIAIIIRRIEPSSTTFQEIYTAASMFAGENTTGVLFEQASQDQGLNKRSATNVRSMDNRIPGIEYPRSIIQWSFQEEREKGDVSGVFEIEGSYIVASLREKRIEGTTPLDLVRPSIEPLVLREKKAEMLIEQLESSASGDIYAMAGQFGSKVDTLPNISFNSPNIPGYGPEPQIIGDVFNAAQGVQTGPVKGNMGIYMFIVDNITEAPAKDDYSAEIQRMTAGFQGKVSRDYFRVLEELSDIEDNRAMFF